MREVVSNILSILIFFIVTSPNLFLILIALHFLKIIQNICLIRKTYLWEKTDGLMDPKTLPNPPTTDPRGLLSSPSSPKLSEAMSQSRPFIRLLNISYLYIFSLNSFMKTTFYFSSEEKLLIRQSKIMINCLINVCMQDYPLFCGLFQKKLPIPFIVKLFPLYKMKKTKTTKENI